eukprot:CAMPEP_0196575102 /NCGR_PEP_ID=MMETSP1081-20130531/4662_1 /TAXON_ID=36882 /ORGANISM="Pyramimonas amylifera, Strain CCMP720" /LENGTH=522 /DNA_ID=CAMNT_0041893303 /DNA_START=116 /DNA_END=1684 /DNA_ORIENTATION=+
MKSDWNRILLNLLVLSPLLLLVLCEKEESSEVTDEKAEDREESSADSSEDTYSTPLKMCSVEDFKATLKKDEFFNVLWKNQSKDIEDRMVSKYEEMKCKCGNVKKSEGWSTSQDKKVILASEGTTGSRWITQEFRTLCNVHINEVGHYVASVADGNDAVAQYTWLSDTPVIANFCHLFWAFPNALIVQSLRGAEEWAQKRKDFKPKSKEWQDTWSAALPCEGDDEGSEKFGGEIARGPMAAIDYATMATFVKCVTPPERYVALNVFTHTDSETRTILKENVCPYVVNITHEGGHGGGHGHVGAHKKGHGNAHGKKGHMGGGQNVGENGAVEAGSARYGLGGHIMDMVHHKSRIQGADENLGGVHSKHIPDTENGGHIKEDEAKSKEKEKSESDDKRESKDRSEETSKSEGEEEDKDKVKESKEIFHDGDKEEDESESKREKNGNMDKSEMQHHEEGSSHESKKEENSHENTKESKSQKKLGGKGNFFSKKKFDISDSKENESDHEDKTSSSSNKEEKKEKSS